MGRRNPLPPTVNNPESPSIPFTMDHGKNEGVKKAGERDYTPQIEGTKEGAKKWADQNAPLKSLKCSSMPSLHQLMCYLNPAHPISLL